MGFFIAMGLLLLIGIIIWFSGTMLEKEGKIFEENKQRGKAKVVGYTQTEQSNWIEPMVKIIGLNDGKEYNCRMGNGKGRKYPMDSIIDVEYAPIKSLGIKAIEVHSIENPPGDSIKMGHIFKKIAIALFILAVILGVIGIIV